MLPVQAWFFCHALGGKAGLCGTHAGRSRGEASAQRHDPAPVARPWDDRALQGYPSEGAEVEVDLMSGSSRPRSGGGTSVGHGIDPTQAHWQT